MDSKTFWIRRGHAASPSIYAGEEELITSAKNESKRDLAIFIEDLNFWLDKVFLYQENKTDREAERFMRQLSDGVSRELAGIINDRSLDCRNCKTKKKAILVAVHTPAFLKNPWRGIRFEGFRPIAKENRSKMESR